MKIHEYSAEDFKVVFEEENWKIGLCRYSERFSSFKVMERHLKTPEIFVLLTGNATIYVSNSNGDIKTEEMQNGKVYEVPAKEWHHIVLSKDATVLVVENSDTSKENTEKVIL